jgi:mono/diheme cytochrome c family protein
MRIHTLFLCMLAVACSEDVVEVPTDEGPAQTASPVIESFTADTLSVANGGSVMLSYKVRDAQTVSLAIEGGSLLIPPTNLLEWQYASPPIRSTTTFILTAKNGTVEVTQPLQVTVMGAEVPVLHASIQKFAVSSIDILAGESATLSWLTTNAAEGRILANGMDLMTIATADLADGTQVVGPGATTVYTLVAIGTDGQEVTAVTAVNVTAGGGAVLGGRDLFDRNVLPIVEQRCASCHAGDNVADGPDFMGRARANYYDALTGDPRYLSSRPEDSQLIIKGEHTGPAFTAAEEQTITAWLLKEADERGLIQGGGEVLPPPMDYAPRSVAEAFDRFGNCMSRADWDATYGVNEDTQAAYQNTTQGRCYACHSNGTAGAFLSQSSGDTFEQSRLRPYMLKLVLPTANEDGSFKSLVNAYRHRDKGGDQGHPSYALTAARDDALNRFIDLTLARFSDYSIACP